MSVTARKSNSLPATNFISSSRARYGVSVVEILEKIGRLRGDRDMNALVVIGTLKLTRQHTGTDERNGKDGNGRGG